MTLLTLAIGACLTLTGVVAYIATDAASFTAFIPSVVGILLLAAGLLARKEKLHKHAIHAALVIALIGLIGSFMNVIKLGDLIAGEAQRPGAVIASTVMFVALTIYLIAGIRSFVRAGRYRRNQESSKA